MARTNQKEINEKISKALKKNKKFIECKECGKLFHQRTKTSKYCCRSCRSKNSMKNISKETRERLRINAINRHANKDGIGFQTRTKFKSSYPEKLTEDFLLKNEIRFEREVKIKKWFADFIIGNIVLEIDGQQHNQPERKAKDLEKDFDLSRLGYTVNRISWTGNHLEFFTKLEKFAEQFKCQVDPRD